MTTDIDPCQHVCAACGKCPDCCEGHSKTKAWRQAASGHNRDRRTGRRRPRQVDIAPGMIRLRPQ